MGPFTHRRDVGQEYRNEKAHSKMEIHVDARDPEQPNSLKKKNRVKELLLPNFKTYYKITLSKKKKKLHSSRQGKVGKWIDIIYINGKEFRIQKQTYISMVN